MITTSSFGTLPDGRAAECFHIENTSGAYVEVISFGACIRKICVPDKNGRLVDVVLGYDSLDGYQVNSCFFGAIIGRSGNRIENAKFKIHDTEVVLPVNENNNNLHSGPDGFEKKLWTAEISQEENALTFSRISPDGENGFPGEMKVTVKYTFSEDNKLSITYGAVCNKASVANMTNHSYFNLDGEGSGQILDTELTLSADQFTEVREGDSIPTGRNLPVEGTPFDFRTPRSIGERIDLDDEQLKRVGGYDHNLVANGYQKGLMRPVALAYSKKSGIAMEVTTDQPCFQFYAGNYIVHEEGKNGHIYTKRDGFCLETQVEPNAVNVPAFHSPVIEAGEQYSSTTAYRFFTK